jgi:hypothetical protein
MRLRRDRFEPPPQAGRVGVDFRWRRAQQPRDRLHCGDLVTLLNRRQIRVLNQRDEIGERRS